LRSVSGPCSSFALCFMRSPARRSLDRDQRPSSYIRASRHTYLPSVSNLHLAREDCGPSGGWKWTRAGDRDKQREENKMNLKSWFPKMRFLRGVKDGKGEGWWGLKKRGETCNCSLGHSPASQIHCDPATNILRVQWMLDWPNTHGNPRPTQSLSLCRSTPWGTGDSLKQPPPPWVRAHRANLREQKGGWSVGVARCGFRVQMRCFLPHNPIATTTALTCISTNPHPSTRQQP